MMPSNTSADSESMSSMQTAMQKGPSRNMLSTQAFGHSSILTRHTPKHLVEERACLTKETLHIRFRADIAHSISAAFSNRQLWATSASIEMASTLHVGSTCSHPIRELPEPPYPNSARFCQSRIPVQKTTMMYFVFHVAQLIALVHQNTKLRSRRLKILQV